MDSNSLPADPLSALRELYPTLSERELKQAEANLTRYLEIAFEIYQEHAENVGAVDTSEAAPTIKERSKSSNQN
jgi:hypothetical protein